MKRRHKRKAQSNRSIAPEIGQRLGWLLETSGMTVAAVGRRSGVRPEAVGRLLRGERLPLLPALAAIARACDVPAGWLVFGEGRRPCVVLATITDWDRRRAETVDALRELA